LSRSSKTGLSISPDWSEEAYASFAESRLRFLPRGAERDVAAEATVGARTSPAAYLRVRRLARTAEGRPAKARLCARPGLGLFERSVEDGRSRGWRIISRDFAKRLAPDQHFGLLDDNFSCGHTMGGACDDTRNEATDWNGGHRRRREKPVFPRRGAFFAAPPNAHPLVLRLTAHRGRGLASAVAGRCRAAGALPGGALLSRRPRRPSLVVSRLTSDLVRIGLWLGAADPPTMIEWAPRALLELGAGMLLGPFGALLPHETPV